MQAKFIFHVMAFNGTRRQHFMQWRWGSVYLVKVPMMRDKYGARIATEEEEEQMSDMCEVESSFCSRSLSFYSSVAVV